MPKRTKSSEDSSEDNSGRPAKRHQPSSSVHASLEESASTAAESQPAQDEREEIDHNDNPDSTHTGLAPHVDPIFVLSDSDDEDGEDENNDNESITATLTAPHLEKNNISSAPDTTHKTLPVKDIRDFIADNMSCPICLETTHLAVVTQCGHSFCHQCIFEWFQRNSHTGRPTSITDSDNSNSSSCPSCPSCRTVITVPPVPSFLLRMFEKCVKSSLSETSSPSPASSSTTEEIDVDESDRTWGGLFEDPRKRRRFQPYSRTNLSDRHPSSQGFPFPSSSLTHARMEYSTERIPVVVTRCGNCNLRVDTDNGICNRCAPEDDGADWEVRSDLDITAEEFRRGGWRLV